VRSHHFVNPSLQPPAARVAVVRLLAVAMASNASSLSAHALRGAAAVGAHFVDEAGLACAGAVGSSGRNHDRPLPEPLRPSGGAP